ncbi:KDGP aldolase family protein [Pantoea sp. 1.19]|uniref:2-dehydro-3-deoxy-phosphogluconate aldolase n=1 Tax=Pantoea sp. 1.19 TaxID=1925589 RepID=UPI000948C5FA|nr:KDGP aldolase family protein [Pantoea sp. 1.19]
MRLTPDFYRDRVCLNVLAGSVANARAVWQAAEGHVLVGLLSTHYPDVATAVAAMRTYAAALGNAISVGLGAGDPRQSAKVSAIAAALQPQHVNQVFSGVGSSRAQLGQRQTVVNGLISPTGRPGWVNIATGPLSAQQPAAVVPVETAIALLKEMGGSSVKYFPMGGLKHLAEFRAVAAACAAQDFWLEPTGGIDLTNYEPLLATALEAGVSRVIPHVYSAIVDPATGDTRPQDVTRLLALTRRLVG